MRDTWDRATTLVAIYLSYAIASVSLEHKVWPLVIVDQPVHFRALSALFLGAIATVLLAAGVAPRTSRALVGRVTAGLRHRRAGLWVMVLGLAVIVAGTIAYQVFDRFQNSGDEYAYWFQAEQLAKGRLWAPAPPLGDTFVPYRTWVIGNKWLSQYPPGWPLVMAAALLSGIPVWLANALLGTAGAAMLLSRLWNFEDRQAVTAVVVLYLLTPFYLFNAASFHSHILSADLILALCLCCLWYQRARRDLALVGAGVAFGLIGLTRYYSALLLVPALGHWLFVDNRGGWMRLILLSALGCLPVIALLMAYQYLVTGSALRSTYSLITQQDVFVEFSPRVLAVGTTLTWARFEELGIWASPLLVPVYAWCLASKVRHRSLAFYDWIFPTFVVGYVFFTDLGGNRYGPRYYFDAFPTMLATIISAAPAAGAWAARLWNRPLAANSAAVAAVYLLTTLPFSMAAYHRQIRAREEPYRIAESMGLKQAVVVLESSSGPGLRAEDLARNEESLRASVLYARAGVTVGALRAQFPNRSVWTYRRDDPDKAGRVEAVSPAEPGDVQLGNE